MNARNVLVLLALTACVQLVAADEAAPATQRAEAVALYDRGEYAQSRRLLEQLDAAGALDGALLYRLHFCLRQAGETRAAEAMLERARVALEQENASEPRLETAFYLVNAYQNQKRAADVERVARATIQALESGALPAPTAGLDLFRAAKLHDDLEQHERAAEWYGRAVAALAADEQANRAYLQWAGRYLGEAAVGRRDDAAIDTHLGLVARLGGASTAELDALARARVRLARYTAAREAWTAAIRLDPARADAARYSAQLAAMAAELGSLPAAAPDGRAWTALDKTQLEAAMLAQAEEVKQVRADFATRSASKKKLKPQDYAAFEQRLVDARGRFVAAGLQYVLGGYPIREQAFSAGYATLIFQAKEWQLVPE